MKKPFLVLLSARMGIILGFEDRLRNITPVERKRVQVG